VVNTTGANNVGIGGYALSANTTASNNTAVGYQAAYSNTTGAKLTAVGYQAAYSNTTASQNTAIGYSVLSFNSTGTYNVAVGGESSSGTTLNVNTTGSYNTAVGMGALKSNTTANNNTAVGYQAGYSITTGGFNTILGYGAGDAANIEESVFIGYNSGTAVTGNQNTFIGSESGKSITAGAKNTIIGRYTGNQDSIDIRTASNRIVIADGDGNVGLYMDNNSQAFFGDMARQTDGANLNVNVTGTAMGLNVYQDNSGDTILCKMRHARANTGNYASATMIQFCRDNGTEIGSIKGVQSNVTYNTSSDYRLKENVSYTWDATTRLKQLKPARFNFIADETNTTLDGFLAHEAQAVVPQSVHGTHNEVKVWQSGEELPDGVSVGDNKLDDDGNTIPVMQGIDHSTLVPLLVKTIQELEARITALEG